MSSHRITCVTKSARTPAGHQHITAVGVRGEPGTFTVAEIYKLMDEVPPRTFYTVSESTGAVAVVHKDVCACGVRTLRSHADAVRDNNLDNLHPCG